MDQTIQAPENASPEAQEILNELAGEGHEIAGTKHADSSETVVTNDSKTAAKPASNDKVDDGDAAKIETVDDEKPAKPKIEREQKFVPVSKHNEERHKRQEAERIAAEAKREADELRARLQTPENKPATEAIDAKAKRLAEKHGIDEELAKDLLSEATPNNALTPELEADIKAVKALRAEQEAVVAAQKQDQHFSNEFADVIKEFPDLADRKEELKQLAFSEGNINTSLRRIALEYLHDNPPPKPGRKSAESPANSKSFGATTEVIDFESMTEEQLKELDGAKLDQYIEWRSKR